MEHAGEGGWDGQTRAGIRHGDIMAKTAIDDSRYKPNRVAGNTALQLTDFFRLT